MRLLIKFALLVALVLAPAGFSVAAAATKIKKRFCTVNLVSGDSVRGYFLGADSRQVTVEVDGARRVIRLDRVTNILFIVDFKNERMKGNQN